MSRMCFGIFNDYISYLDAISRNIYIYIYHRIERNAHFYRVSVRFVPRYKEYVESVYKLSEHYCL